MAEYIIRYVIIIWFNKTVEAIDHALAQCTGIIPKEVFQYDSKTDICFLGK